MKGKTPVLEQATALVSETIGNEAGKIFHKFYEFDDDDGVIMGARSLLTNFIGPKMTEEKIKILKGK